MLLFETLIFSVSIGVTFLIRNTSEVLVKKISNIRLSQWLDRRHPRKIVEDLKLLVVFQ